MLGHKPLQLRGDLCVTAEVEVGIEPVLDCA
jgi:hypothetical protein